MKNRVNVLNRPEELTLDLNEDLPLEGDDEVKLEPEETISERIKINPQKRKIIGGGLKILIPRKLVTRLPILIAQ